MFEDVKVDGVKGEFTRNGKRDPTMPRRQFTIEELTVNNVSLAVTDHARPPHEVSVPVEIESLQIADFRSTWAAFDMLFRSTCRGLVDGQPFTVETRPIDGGAVRETRWIARDLPVYVLSGYFAGPLSWLVDGRFDVDVTTRWQPDDNEAELEMHCRLVAHGFAADVPEELEIAAESRRADPGRAQRVKRPIADGVRRHDEQRGVSRAALAAGGGAGRGVCPGVRAGVYQIVSERGGTDRRAGEPASVDDSGAAEGAGGAAGGGS